MIDIVATTGPYRAAVAELPLSARLGAAASQAIVVVAGDDGWLEAVLAAADAGAAAVVVADPVLVPAAGIRLLGERSRIPIIVERPLLRADAAADASAARGDGTPRTVVVDAGASAARLGVVARDAVGWGRVLAGQALSLVAADRGLALLETEAGITVTVSVAATRRTGRGWVRAQALGEKHTEVAVEGRESSVATATAAGRLILPTRFESSERLAVRRALAALEKDDMPDDLAELAADTEPIERILALRA